MYVLQESVLALLLSSVFINDLDNRKEILLKPQQEVTRSAYLLKREILDQNDNWLEEWFGGKNQSKQKRSF